MLFAVSHPRFSRRSRQLAQSLAVPTLAAALALALTGCFGSSAPEIAAPPTPQPVTRAQMEASSGRSVPMPPNAIPAETPREKKGWLAPLPKVDLWPFGNKEEKKPAPQVAASEPPVSEPKPKTKPKPPAEAGEEAPLPVETDTESRRPGFLRRAVGVLPFVSSGEDDEIAPPPRLPKREQERAALPDVPKSQQVRARSKDLRGLELLVNVDPMNPRASVDRRVSVGTVLYNGGKKSVTLQFKTSQTREITISGAGRAVITRWSEDYVFEQTFTSLVINPGERVEFKDTISTRDLQAGSTYPLVVTIPGYPELTVTTPLAVQK